MGGQRDEVPLCIRCLRPATGGKYYCPHCGEATNPLTAYLPFIDIKFMVDFAGTWWNRATRPGWRWPLRIGSLLVFAMMFPLVVLACIVTWPWRRGRTRSAAVDPQS